MVYNLFIFISLFLLPDIPENRGCIFYQFERNSIFFYFYYNYQEFLIQYYTFAGETNISQKSYCYIFYLFIFYFKNVTSNIYT